MTLSVARPEVTSVAIACASSGVLRMSQSMSRRWQAAEVTTMNFCSSIRVTVRSASMPPFGLSHCV